MDTSAFKTNLARKLKSLRPDYDKIREYAKEQCDVLVVGLRKNRVLPINAVGCVIQEIETYLEIKPRSQGLPTSRWGVVLARRNVNNFTNKICEAIPLAQRDNVEQAVRLGLKDWLDMVLAENNGPKNV